MTQHTTQPASRRNLALFTLGQLHVGGIERNLMQLIEHLGDEYRLFVIADATPTFEAEARSFGKEVTFVRMPRHSLYDLTRVFGLAWLFKRLRIDLVHTTEPRSRLFGHLAARLAGIRTVHTFQITALSYDNPPRKQQLYARVEGLFNRYVSQRLIFVSSNDRAHYERLGLLHGAQVTVVHNAIDVEEVASFRKDRERVRTELGARLGLPEGAVLACTLARIDPQKGLDYLVEAVAHLKATGRLDALYFLIAGDGQDRAELESRIGAHGLRDRVHILGFLAKEEAYQVLSAGDLFVLPSRYESFPYSIVEALAMGLPCVVSDVGGNNEAVIDGQHGFVVPRGDIPALAEAVHRLGTDAALRRQLALNAAARAPEFHVTRMVRQTNAVYHTLLDRP